MIRNITVTNKTKCVVPWWDKAKGTKDIETLEFKPGLNCLYGPNGSGKSTILAAIAKMLCCHQGGRQKVTGEAVREVYTHEGLRDGVLPDHDGSPIMYFDPGAAVGLIGGMAGFDPDIMFEGAQNCTFHGSSGQITGQRMMPVLDAILKGKWPTQVEWTAHNHEGRYDWLGTFLKGTGDKTCPTLLLDEPSRSLDLRSELGLWRIIDKAVQSGVQVIVATHAVFPLNRPDVNFIETVPNYLKHTRVDLEFYYLLPEAFRLLDPLKKGSTETSGA